MASPNITMVTSLIDSVYIAFDIERDSIVPLQTNYEEDRAPIPQGRRNQNATKFCKWKSHAPKHQNNVDHNISTASYQKLASGAFDKNDWASKKYQQTDFGKNNSRVSCIFFKFTNTSGCRSC